MENKINLRIGGPAGRGIMSTGAMFAKACSRIGLHVYDYIEYPSLIKGGHNTYLVRAEDTPISAQLKLVDILIALDEITMTIHTEEMKDDSIIIYDGETLKPERTKLGKGIRCPIPLKTLIKEAGGEELMENTVALAAALGVMQYDFSVFEGLIKDAFKGKGPEIVQQNINVARKGYDYARKQYGNLNQYRLKQIPAPPRMIMSGNEAIALGAIKAGVKFYAAYPMTPASTILHTLAAWQKKHNIVVKHAEDEISVVNMGIGAGYAGVRSMVGTSGGGFALMSEAVSLAGIVETPLVMVEAMRGGPATGLPTWTEQSDLRFILHAGHGEFPRFVLAPGDVAEAFWLTIEAFNIADVYQAAVIIISDKYLSEGHQSVDLFDQSKVKIDRGKLITTEPKQPFMRYIDSPDGISPRSIPGVPKAFFLANSDEHDPFGYSTEDDYQRRVMMEKRMRKEVTYAKLMPQPILYGPEEADLTIVGWGSTKMPIQEGMKFLKNDGFKVNFLHLTHILPFPTETVTKVLSKAKKTLLIENTFTGQMAGLIREKTGIEIKEKFLKYDGRPFYPEEIYTKVASMVKA